jgi:hypothetical protein
MDFSEHLLQGREKREGKGFFPLDGSSRNEFHGKGETINSLYWLRDPFDPGQSRVDLPFFLNEPKPQCPAEKKGLSPDILDHEDTFAHLHLIQIRLPKTPFADANKILFNILPIH